MRMSRKKDVETIQTNAYILTFNTPKVPKELKIGYTIVKVETYIPNSLRCYNRQEFGPGKDRCTRTPVCVRSSKSNANHTNGKQDPHCPNCRKKHTTESKDCKMSKKEKEILRIKYTQNIPFPGARKIVEATKYAVYILICNLLYNHPHIEIHSYQGRVLLLYHLS